MAAIRLLALVAVVTASHLRQKLPEGVVALDKDMKTQMLVQVQSVAEPAGICAGIECGELSCPGGFKATKLDGHCCAYCINPNIKLEDPTKGATGEFGGKKSVFCDNVWCFPTLCNKDIKNPSTENKQCCAECPQK